MSQGSLQQDDTTETDLDEESESEYSDTFRHSCEIALHFLPLLIVMIGSLAWTCQMAITSRSLLSDTDLTYLAQLNRSAFMWYDLRQLNAADQLRIALSQLPVVAVFGILTLIVVLGTLLMACLFERGCFRLLQCWLIMAYALMLGPITAFLLHRSVSGRYAFCIDMATILILFWNFVVIGVGSVHFNMGPLKLKCAIILWICITFTCLINILLLKWVTWLLLVLLVVWDAVAVLTPCGPLRRIAMAVDTNAKNDALYSSLAYTVPTKPRRRQTKLSNSATLVSVSMSKEQNESTYDAPKPIEDMQSDHTSEMSVGTKSMSLTQMSKSENGRNKKPLQGSGVKSASLKPNQFVRTSEWIEEENAVGLGDLVFYAVLIQLVFESDSSWFVLIACILTILVGLYLTTCLMIITSKPLPALPLSIGVTMIVFNIIRYTRLTTLANQYTTAHTFV